MLDRISTFNGMRKNERSNLTTSTTGVGGNNFEESKYFHALEGTRSKIAVPVGIKFSR
jgi:hypothetical protein